MPEDHEKTDPCWESQPYLHQVYVRSGGLLDQVPEYHFETRMWMAPLMEVAAALDTLQGSGEGMPDEAEPLAMAFDTLLVLVDQAWWRDHAPRPAQGDAHRHLVRLSQCYDTKARGSSLITALASGPEATWSCLEQAVCAAAETFARVRDGEALADCARVVAAFAE